MLRRLDCDVLRRHDCDVLRREDGHVLGMAVNFHAYCQGRKYYL